VSLPRRARQNRQQSVVPYVVPYSVQVKLKVGLFLRTSLATAFSPQPGPEIAYPNDFYFMIRCEPWIMNNLREDGLEVDLPAAFWAVTFE
jgi:hypothetical protein